MKFFKIIVLLSLLVSLVIAQDESDIIEEVQDLYEDIEYFSADFIQKEQFKLTGSENETKGKIYIKNGTEYRLETEDQIVVTDGKVVWSYSPHNNQVIVDNVKEGDASLLPRDMLFRYPKNYFSNLLKEEKIDASKYYVLKMTPKEDIHGYIKSLKIWVNTESYLINKIEYDDLNDNTSLFQIEKMDIKSELPDSLFIFNPPPQSELIDMR
ncbi:MAG: outer membrane lipoprotein chaperone LolA [Calditrichia bacterium]|nr:outer membrane lipoprotein chaperone LolA [Calditrichia bacterium]